MTRPSCPDGRPEGRDGRVMPHFAPGSTIRGMTTKTPTDLLVLDEFRLHAADTDGTAAGIVSKASKDIRDPVPLLTSIDDPRDVATLRTVGTGATDSRGPRGDAALGELVATWQPVKRYRSRIAARSQGAPSSSFRLAVTARMRATPSIAESACVFLFTFAIHSGACRPLGVRLSSGCSVAEPAVS